MESRPDRWVQLQRLLGDDVILGEDDAAIQSLTDWFRTGVEANPNQPGRLTDPP